MTVLQELAEFVVREGPLEPARRSHVFNMVVDTLCSASAAAASPMGAIALSIAARRQTSGVAGHATVIGGPNLDFESAAYVNTLLANALDFEPVGPEGHLIASIVPAVFALSEAGDLSLSRALDAIAIGIEVGARVGLAIRRPAFVANGGKTPDVQGMSSVAIGAAAALAKLSEFDVDMTANALAMATYGAPVPLMRRAFDASIIPTTKYDPLASHTRAAFEAIELAAAGGVGDPSAVDGDFGLWRVFGHAGFDSDAALKELGTHWYLDDEVWFKKYPVVLYSNPIVDAMAELGREFDVSPDQVESVAIEHWNPKPGEKLQRVDSESGAWLSIPINAALAFSNVQPLQSWRDAASFTDPGILRIASVTSVTIVGEERRQKRGSNGLWNGWSPWSVTVTAGGQTRERHADGLRRFTEDELRSKWVQCLSTHFGEGADAQLEFLLTSVNGSARELIGSFQSAEAVMVR